MWLAAITYQLCGDRRGCRDLADAVVTLSAEHRFPSTLAMGTFLSGWARAEGDDTEAGIRLMEQGIRGAEATRRIANRPHMLGLLAEARASRGRVADALDTVTKALALATETGQGFYEPELHRLRGEFALALRPRDAAAAESSFQLAIELARRQSAMSLALRAATSLARVRRDRGRHNEARDLLAPVYGWFTGGFDTPDSKDARALLNELSRS
jgi:predicted ATPase